jgi:outer membrane protein OmpA-like peptidoglycan-associated protein
MLAVHIWKLKDHLNLSKACADAVVKKLISDDVVSATSLKSYGIGPLAPVVSKRTDECRALNRRGELGEQSQKIPFLLLTV